MADSPSRSKSTGKAAVRSRRGRLGPKALEKLALRCWTWAQSIEEPTRLAGEGESRHRRVVGTEEDAHAVLHRAIGLHPRPGDPIAARQVLKILQDEGSLRSLISQGDNRAHWAMWRMMNILLERSVYDATRRCLGRCEYPKDSVGYCPAERSGGSRARCAKSLIFPYRRKHAAAVAVHAGFVRARLLSPLITVASVLRQYERHFKNR